MYSDCWVSKYRSMRVDFGFPGDVVSCNRLFPLDLTSAQYWGMGILAAVGLFGSLIFHELSHSVVARWFGIPMKGITLFIFGGVAHMEEDPPSPKSEFDHTIQADCDAAKALAHMNKTGSGRLLVLDEDRLVGVVVLKDLLKYLAFRTELEGMENVA